MAPLLLTLIQGSSRAVGVYLERPRSFMLWPMGRLSSSRPAIVIVPDYRTGLPSYLPPPRQPQGPMRLREGR